MTPPVTTQTLTQALLRLASPTEPDAGYFAAMLGKNLTHHALGRFGLSPAALRTLIEALFPSIFERNDPLSALLNTQLSTFSPLSLPLTPHPDFTQALRQLLRAWQAPQLALTASVTEILIQACQRPDHLWRDLGFTNRADVTALLTRHYPGLVARNIHHLRWKKFLAYSAYEAAGQPLAAAPGCPDCEDYHHCYRA